MDFQYFETLLDKSDNSLLYFVEQIIPFFKKEELLILLDDLAGKPLNKSVKSSKATGFIEINDDYDKNAELSKLKSEQLKLLYQIFISKELNEKKDVKWRFYQYLKFVRGFNFKSIHVNRTNNENSAVDFIIEMENREIFFVNCGSILKLENYTEIITNIIKFSKNRKIVPDKIIIAANKSYRNIPITEAFTIQKYSIIPELWIEWVDLNKMFNGDDLLIMSNNKGEILELAGFNFSGTEDLLDYIYENSNGGQISIFKQIGYYSETVQKEQKPKVELIWRGIMIKEKSS